MGKKTSRKVNSAVSQMERLPRMAAEETVAALWFSGSVAFCMDNFLKSSRLACKVEMVGSGYHGGGRETAMESPQPEGPFMTCSLRHGWDTTLPKAGVETRAAATDLP